MTSREEFDNLLGAVKLIDSVLKNQEEKRTELFDKIGKIYGQVVTDEEILSTVIWTDGYRGLEPARGQDDAADKIDKLFYETGQYRGYHWSFEIEDGVSFRSDDFKISICFDDEKVIPGFIKRHNLTIDTAELDAKIKATKSKLTDLLKTKVIFDARRDEETEVSETEAEG